MLETCKRHFSSCLIILIPVVQNSLTQFFQKQYRNLNLKLLVNPKQFLINQGRSSKVEYIKLVYLLKIYNEKNSQPTLLHRINKFFHFLMAVVVEFFVAGVLLDQSHQTAVAEADC